MLRAHELANMNVNAARITVRTDPPSVQPPLLEHREQLELVVQGGLGFEGDAGLGHVEGKE